MIKWLLQLVYALSLKRVCGRVSLRVALRSVSRNTTWKVEIENLEYMIEVHVRKGVSHDTESD